MDSTVLKVTGINHVVLHVSDMERSLKFYMGVLGFESRNIDMQPGHARAFLRCGEQGLDLFEVTEDVHGGEEMNHMALCVAADNLDEVVAALAAAEVDASEPTNRKTVFIHDPDGHQIEILPLAARHREAERDAMRTSV